MTPLQLANAPAMEKRAAWTDWADIGAIGLGFIPGGNFLSSGYYGARSIYDGFTGNKAGAAANALYAGAALIPGGTAVAAAGKGLKAGAGAWKAGKGISAAMKAGKDVAKAKNTMTIGQNVARTGSKALIASGGVGLDVLAQPPGRPDVAEKVRPWLPEALQSPPQHPWQTTRAQQQGNDFHYVPRHIPPYNPYGMNPYGMNPYGGYQPGAYWTYQQQLYPQYNNW